MPGPTEDGEEQTVGERLTFADKASRERVHGGRQPNGWLKDIHEVPKFGSPFVVLPTKGGAQGYKLMPKKSQPLILNSLDTKTLSINGAPNNAY